MEPAPQETQPAGEYNLAGVYLGAMVDTRALEKVSQPQSWRDRPAWAGMMLCYCFMSNEMPF